MTSRIRKDLIIEEPLWFGDDGRPLCGWLSWPADGSARGGVLLAPPIGREARAGRHAMRDLAGHLAAQGFVTLRFDYEGTGDSSGGFNDPERNRMWIDSVVEAAKFLRALGVESLSAVGMRLGATLVGVAAVSEDLKLDSVVMWDPCESGRSYLRELRALEALRRDGFRTTSDSSIETSEYVFSPLAVEEIGQLDLSKVAPVPFAQRTLVMVRSDRAVSTRLRTHLEGETITWEATDQQSALLDVDPSWAWLPYQTMERIVRWLSEPNSDFTPIAVGPRSKDAVVAIGENGVAVSERIVEFGPERLFGIVTTTVGDVKGPLVVMFNVANEEHTGPSRLWVELSRRWAGFGLRCVRFDFRSLGDSPQVPGKFEHPFFIEGWLDDLITVTQELSPGDASNSVFIGVCSGAYWAVEAARKLHSRGVCVINPPPYIDYLHSIRTIEASRQPLLQKIGERLKQLARHPWIAAGTWHMVRSFLPSKWSADLLEELDEDDTDLLLLYSSEEIWPFPGVPFFRSIDVRRLSNSSRRHVELVPGLDHGMHFAEGRARAVNILDRHVLEHFAGVLRDENPGTISTES